MKLTSDEKGLIHRLAVAAFNRARPGYTAHLWWTAACYTGARCALRRRDFAAARNWLRSM